MSMQNANISGIQALSALDALVDTLYPSSYCFNNTITTTFDSIDRGLLNQL